MPRELSSTEHDRWDAFVAGSAEGSVFQSTAYLRARGAQFSIVVHEHGQEILAGAVLARDTLGGATTPLFVKHLGVAFAPFAGSRVARQSARRRALTALLPAFAGIATFDYTFAPAFDDWLPFFWAGYQQRTQYTYRIVHTAAGTWRSEADHRVRNDEKRARRGGIGIAPAASAAALCGLVHATYRRQRARTPLGAARLGAFLAALDAAGCLTVLEARDGVGQVVAAAGLVHDARTTYLLLSGYADAAPPGATTLLVGAAIDHAHAHGRDFDFEGSMIRPIEAFYRGFGGALTPYFRIWRPSVANHARQWATRVAKRWLNYAR